MAEEYAEVLSVARASALARLVAATDRHQHVIAVHHTKGDRTFDFGHETTVTQFALQASSTSPEAIHRDVLAARQSTGGRASVNVAENWNQGLSDHAEDVKHGRREAIRHRNWAAAMAGAHVMVVGTWHPKIGAPPAPEVLGGHAPAAIVVRANAPGPDEPRDDLAGAGEPWVLAQQGPAYIAYGTAAQLGIEGLRPGRYRLLWFDPATGKGATETVTVESPAPSWSRPAGFGPDVALALTCADRR